uniref:Remorin C-terminal domain-containing protein n=1 Tax=Salix viminalis TaxID=40686 RepID=A0A6N2MUI8_SALVM
MRSEISSFEFHIGNRATGRGGHHRTALGKPTPSKWDDAQKWLVGLSRGGGGDRKESKPRNSNADDRIAQFPNELTIKIDKPEQNPTMSAVRSICVRDMGTEMTPIASQELQEQQHRLEPQHRRRGALYRQDLPPQVSVTGQHYDKNLMVLRYPRIWTQNRQRCLETRMLGMMQSEQIHGRGEDPSLENHEKRKAEMEMRKMEYVKAERLKARAQERLANKLASTKRIAEENVQMQSHTE